MWTWRLERSKSCRSSLARDLKIVVMSATINADPLTRFLEAPALDIPGKVFPLEIHYEQKPQLLRTGPEFTERMAKLVRKAAYEQSAGDVLCFLPGRGEIERLRQELSSWSFSAGCLLIPLHGQLGLEEQRSVLTPAPGKRKVILATNVAESSLTVPGVRVVVDSGLARQAQLHPRTGFESLDLIRISKAAATQRAGRAAREAAGAVYRAWMPYDELSMKEFEPAEVLRTDLSESLLLLSALGLTKHESFSWFEAPPTRSLEQARQFLSAIGALAQDGSLTELGRSIRDIPAHPRLAKLLLLGSARGLTGLTAELAALLGESGRLPSGGEGAENDLWLRWRDWKHSPRGSVKRAAEQLSRLVPGKKQDSTLKPEKEIPFPLASRLRGSSLPPAPSPRAPSQDDRWPGSPSASELERAIVRVFPGDRAQ
jgi:ATP-dependent helicase HrpB